MDKDEQKKAPAEVEEKREQPAANEPLPGAANAFGIVPGVFIPGEF